jgi:hypothetical protein
MAMSDGDGSSTRRGANPRPLQDLDDDPSRWAVLEEAVFDKALFSALVNRYGLEG